MSVDEAAHHALGPVRNPVLLCHKRLTQVSLVCRQIYASTYQLPLV
jgi:hypothetical protein